MTPKDDILSKRQVEAASRAIKRVHANYGYRRPLKADYIERLSWAVYFSILLTKRDDKRRVCKRSGTEQ